MGFDRDNTRDIAKEPYRVVGRDENKHKEIYLPESYRNRLLDKLHNLRQGSMSLQDYIARFDCDVREDRFQFIFRFCSGLRSDVRRVMITSSYHVAFKEAFHLALALELSFKGISISKVRSSVLSVRDMNIMITSAPRRVDMLTLCLVIMLMTRALLKMSTFLSRLLVPIRIH